MYIRIYKIMMINYSPPSSPFYIFLKCPGFGFEKSGYFNTIRRNIYAKQYQLSKSESVKMSLIKSVRGKFHRWSVNVHWSSTKTPPFHCPVLFRLNFDQAEISLQNLYCTKSLYVMCQIRLPECDCTQGHCLGLQVARITRDSHCHQPIAPAKFCTVILPTGPPVI